MKIVNMNQKSRVFVQTVLVAMLPLLLIACEKKKAEETTSAGNCDVIRNDSLASAEAGTTGTELVMLNGRRITPVGKGLKLGTFPIGAALSSKGLLAVQSSGHGDNTLEDRSTLVTTATRSHQALDLIDVANWKVLWTVPLRSSFVGIAWAPGGRTLYVSGGGRDVLRTIDVPLNGTPSEMTEVTLAGYPTGMVVSPDGKRLYAALLHKPGVAEFSLEGTTPVQLRTLATQAGPYGLALSPNGKWLFVSNWATTSMSKIELATGTSSAVEVGKNPEGVAVSGDSKTVWVAASDEDKVTVVDAATLKVKSVIDLRDDPSQALGRSPTDLILDEARDRLYVVLAHENAIQVIKASDGTKLGLLPTAFYPTEVELEPASGALFSVSAKGFGAGPNRNDEAVYRIIRGTAHKISYADDNKLATYTAQVRQNNAIGSRFYDASCANARNPVPLGFGDNSSPIKRVVYIMRENKTYDALLGDLGPAHKGDPSLNIFGKRITPNLHRLALDFANLTNFYSESEQSIQGHIWGGNGWVNDFSEKTWIAMWGRPGEGQVILPGIEPASAPKIRDLFTHASRKGKSVRIYGEYSGIIDDLTGETKDLVNWKFPVGFGIDDQVKIREFKRELDLGKLAEFTFISIGNDHTFGGQPGRPTPEYMVADNDAATGQIIEMISKSPFWKETVIFVFEDDPQGTPDHIDAHRTIGVVVSPWTRNVGDSDTLYSVPSMHKTMNLILGLPPISRHTEIAAAMYDAFNNQPDTSEWISSPSNIPYAENPDDGSEVAEESKKMDFSGVDKAPGVGRILWKMYKETPYPDTLAAEGDDDDD